MLTPSFFSDWGNDEDVGITTDFDIDRELYGNDYASGTALESNRESIASSRKSQPSSSRAGYSRTASRTPTKKTNNLKPPTSAKKNSK